MVEEITNSKSLYILAPESVENSLIPIEAYILKALENNSKIIIQAENIYQISDNLRRLTVRDDFTWLPIMIINEEILYYGYPFINSNYISHNSIIRLEGKNTIRNLIPKLNIKSHLINSQQGLNTGFGNFVGKYLRCEKCKSPPLIVRRNTRNKYFIGCTNFPNCDYTEMISREIMNFYLEKYNIKCNECHGNMEARIGKYGLFIGCKNYPECKNTKGIGNYR